jgi:hypothetical protein
LHTTRRCDCKWPTIALQTPHNNQAYKKFVLEFAAGLKRRALETLKEPSQLLLRLAKQRQLKTMSGVVTVGCSLLRERYTDGFCESSSSRTERCQTCTFAISAKKPPFSLSNC